MMTHTVALVCGACSLTVTSSSALLVFGVVGVVCVTAVVVTKIASSSTKENTEWMRKAKKATMWSVELFS